jgi:hypothetical protein
MIIKIKPIVFLVLLMSFSKIISAQEMKSFSDFPKEIQTKINENKSTGKPLFQGVNFKYNITINSNYKDTYPKNSDVESVLNQLKPFFSIDKYSYSYSDKGELLLVFEMENNVSYDDMKIKLTELKLYMLAINLTVSLK